MSENRDLPAGGPLIYVVATPIGNLGDVTERARRVLEAVDVVAAEDTRETKKLLSHLGINGKRLVSYQDHGEAERAAVLVDSLERDHQTLALVTDAGTPCVSDPGYRLVALAKSRGIPVHPVPGASALTALASAAGLPTDRLLFIGFLPTKAKALTDEIESWRAARASVVFFEATRRLGKTLQAIAAVHPQARVAVGRELTKLYEEIVTLDIAEAQVWMASHATLKGEATVMVSLPKGEDQATGADEDELFKEARQQFRRGATLKDLLGLYKDRGLKRPALYQLLLRAKADA